MANKLKVWKLNEGTTVMKSMKVINYTKRQLWLIIAKYFYNGMAGINDGCNDSLHKGS